MLHFEFGKLAVQTVLFSKEAKYLLAKLGRSWTDSAQRNSVE